MSKFRKLWVPLYVSVLLTAGILVASIFVKSNAQTQVSLGDAAPNQTWSIGNSASQEQIAGWDIDVRPDGVGLPTGSGSVEEGEALYEAQCAHCHGVFGEGEGRWPVLAGGVGSLQATGSQRPIKTVASYWPYASTLWDYIRRAMPFTAPMSLNADQTYAITAYVLYLNELVDYDFVLDNSNFTDIRLPNETNFSPNSDAYLVDGRPDTFNTDCMQSCTDPKSITITSTISGITPVSHFKEGTGSPAATHSGEDPIALSAVNQTATEQAGSAETSAKDTLMAQGKTIYQSNCAACHQAGGEGLGSTFPALKGNAVVLGDVAAHIAVLLNGRQGTAMVSFSRLSDRDLAAVLTYQRNAWGNSAEVDLVTPDMVRSQR